MHTFKLCIEYIIPVFCQMCLKTYRLTCGTELYVTVPSQLVPSLGMMKRAKLLLPMPDPMVRDLALVVAASLAMSLVFFTAGYMVFMTLAGQ